jgi:hypothetical protein
MVVLKCIFHYTVPQYIWIMQDSAELAWSKSVIVEVRKGDEGLLIHLPFELLGFVSRQPKIRVQVQPRAEFARGLVFEPSTGLFLDVERAIPVYLRHSQPAVKENAQKR